MSTSLWSGDGGCPKTSDSPVQVNVWPTISPLLRTTPHFSQMLNRSGGEVVGTPAINNKSFVDRGSHFKQNVSCF